MHCSTAYKPELVHNNFNVHTTSAQYCSIHTYGEQYTHQVLGRVAKEGVFTMTTFAASGQRLPLLQGEITPKPSHLH